MVSGLSMQASRDNFDAFCSLLAGLADAAAAFLGLMLATWIRFDSGLIPLKHNEIFPPRIMYVAAAATLAPLLVIIFRQIGLYLRPQLGPFGDKLPRIVRGVSVTLAPFTIPQSSTLFGINSSLVLDLPVMLLVMLIMTVPALAKGRMNRAQGIILLAIYAAFCVIQFVM